jgi:4a-hydroxytetrahydrobiopterin dehydratase
MLASSWSPSIRRGPGREKMQPLDGDDSLRVEARELVRVGLRLLDETQGFLAAGIWPDSLTVAHARGNVVAMARLSDSEIEARLASSPWRREGEAIVLEVERADFAAAVALVNEVARLAEEANHHPDILLHGWNKLRLTLSTHSEGGLTAADFELAAKIDGLV